MCAPTCHPSISHLLPSLMSLFRHGQHSLPLIQRRGVSTCPWPATIGPWAWPMDKLGKCVGTVTRLAAFVVSQKPSTTFFFECTYGKFLWRAVHMVQGLSPPLNVQNYFDDRYPTRGKSFRSFLLTRASMICWFIWLTKNEVIFDKCRPNALMHVLFKGTRWLWAQLQLSEEQNKMILQACRQLGNVYVFFSC